MTPKLNNDFLEPDARIIQPFNEEEQNMLDIKYVSNFGHKSFN